MTNYSFSQNVLGSLSGSQLELRLLLKHLYFSDKFNWLEAVSDWVESRKDVFDEGMPEILYALDNVTELQSFFKQLQEAVAFYRFEYDFSPRTVDTWTDRDVKDVLDWLNRYPDAWTDCIGDIEDGCYGRFYGPSRDAFKALHTRKRAIRFFEELLASLPDRPMLFSAL